MNQVSLSLPSNNCLPCSLCSRQVSGNKSFAELANLCEKSVSCGSHNEGVVESSAVCQHYVLVCIAWLFGPSWLTSCLVHAPKSLFALRLRMCTSPRNVQQEEGDLSVSLPLHRRRCCFLQNFTVQVQQMLPSNVPSALTCLQSATL